MNIALKLFNAVGFYLGWFVCVSLGNFYGGLYVSIFIGLHVIFLVYCQKHLHLQKEIYWLLTITLLGFLIESLFLSLNILYIQGANTNHWQLPPLWLIGIWMLFASSLRTSLSWLLNRSWINVFLTAIAAPFNYWVGTQMNSSVSLDAPLYYSLSTISLVWMVFLWILIHIKQLYFEDIFNDS